MGSAPWLVSVAVRSSALGHLPARCEAASATKSGASKVPLVWRFWRKTLGPGGTQDGCARAGTLPSSSTAVVVYACWFQTRRVFTQLSLGDSSSWMPRSIWGKGHLLLHTELATLRISAR